MRFLSPQFMYCLRQLPKESPLILRGTRPSDGRSISLESKRLYAAPDERLVIHFPLRRTLLPTECHIFDVLISSAFHFCFCFYVRGPEIRSEESERAKLFVCFHFTGPTAGGSVQFVVYWKHIWSISMPRGAISLIHRQSIQLTVIIKLMDRTVAIWLIRSSPSSPA